MIEDSTFKGDKLKTKFYGHVKILDKPVLLFGTWAAGKALGTLNHNKLTDPSVQQGYQPQLYPFLER